MSRLNKELGVPYCTRGYYVIDPLGENMWCADLRIALWEADKTPGAEIVTADEKEVWRCS